MNQETLRDYCLSLPGTSEELPFGPDTLVFKVSGKVFLLMPLDSTDFRFNAKCDPEIAEELRSVYTDVLPGYHMNKKHWNTVLVTGSISSDILFGWVRDSYNLIVGSLPKKEKEALNAGLRD